MQKKFAEQKKIFQKTLDTTKKEGKRELDVGLHFPTNYIDILVPGIFFFSYEASVIIVKINYRHLHSMGHTPYLHLNLIFAMNKLSKLS